MCGIAGILFSDSATRVDAAVIDRMTEVIRHRGPDDGGVWTDGAIGLGNRRLAVIDLSPRGHQPMSHADGRFTIAFNGEIYNFRELRQDLEKDGHRFRSESDTEVILHLYEKHGTSCLALLRGMFALAIWDRARRTLLLARDRLGKKPLFYYSDERQLVFGSEAKCILEVPGVDVTPDPVAIHHYLTYGYVPAPWSAFRDFRKLPPAHFLIANESGVRIEPYWTLHYGQKRRGTADALGEELVSLLEDSVRLRLISDVPLGALLSGGLDSSVVVAMMRRFTPGRLRTFSIGFDQPEYDELAYARQVAERFETDHYEMVVRPNVVDLLPKLVWHYNEPFADSSALPSFCVSQMARQHVTVALNGDGGDESFVGYDRYLAMRLGRIPNLLLPTTIRAAVGRVASRVTIGGPKSTTYRMRRFAETLGYEDWQRYLQWMVFFDNDAKKELYTDEFASLVAPVDSSTLLRDAIAASDAPSAVEKFVDADRRMYLPDDLLVKMDIASMATSLEVRSPLLDHKVVEFAASLPLDLKLRGTTKKYLLKHVMRGILPDRVRTRPKMGFGVPLDRWFRGELRPMLHETLLDGKAIQRGYFRRSAVERYIEQHDSGGAHHHFRLWALLMLELWHRTFIDATQSSTAAAVCE